MKKEGYFISGIQQLGVGVENVEGSWPWYKQNFGMNVPVFRDSGEATLMARYTGNMPQNRYAILALNLAGGGGFEIWQFTDRKSDIPKPDVVLGDLGINAGKMKCSNISEAKAFYQNAGIDVLFENEKSFFVKDPNGNWFQIIESKSWFNEKKSSPTGGVAGVIIGVSNMDKSIAFYQGILQYNQVTHDKEITLGGKRYRSVLLQHKEERKGPFSQLFGFTEIELLQALDRDVSKTYHNRYWGDPGFIHLCFDVVNMDALQTKVKEFGTNFTVDSSNSFDMGDAAGRFSYIEDPDGTLIEFVETHKVPVMKKWGLYFNLKKRNPEKPLPRLFIKALGLNK
jgi:catechol 2,3-dioxygenase-like lactoylglutathione lyase family enzyme